MRIHFVGLGLFSFFSSTLFASGASPPAHRDTPQGAEGGLFQYRFERGALGYDDLVRLWDGSQHIGKALEWADQVLLFDGQGHPTAFDAVHVKEFELRPARRQLTCPALPDLTVAYIERLPRDLSWHGHVKFEAGLPKADVSATGVSWRPAPGAKITFKVHVLNAGAAKSSAVDGRVLLDGKPLSSMKLSPLDPGAEQVVDVSWQWQDGPHIVRVEIDPGATQNEVVRWNNTFEEPTQALGVAVVVARDRYDAFKKIPNLVDSFCFEDWAQYHIRCMNGLFSASVYPSAPKGIIERVRCDRILVVDNPSDSVQRAAWEPSLRQRGSSDGLSEEAGVVVFDALPAAEFPMYAARKIAWPKLKQIGLQLGLIDLRATDTTIDQCRVPDQGDRFAVRQHLFPWPRTLMYAPGGDPLSEVCAGYLNAAVGKPRGFAGEYLYRLPEKITLEIRSNSGAPLEGVQVEAFQLQADPPQGTVIMGTGRDPLYSAVSDSNGRLDLPNLETPVCVTPNGYELHPNPFGKIATDGSNGLLLFRIRHTHEKLVREEFHFLRLFDCLVANLHGDRQQFVRSIQTRFPDATAPLSPPITVIVMDDRSTAKPPLKLQWGTMSSLLDLEEFRVYRRTGLGGDDETPWILNSTVRKGGRKWTLEADATYHDPSPSANPYTPDTYFAVSAVDKNGHESGLANPTFLAYDKECLKFAIDTEAAFITLSGDGLVPMLRWDAAAAQQPFIVNASSVKRYKPAFAGIAVTPEHRLIVSDPVNHVLALYDLNGNLEEVMPRRAVWPGYPSAQQGEFYGPADVAVDKQGRIFVADLGNNRVQMLDGSGRFQSLVDGKFNFVRPSAVACSNGRLAITDNDGTRVRIYRIDGGEIKFERHLPPVPGFDRAFVSKAGRIYAVGLDPGTGKLGLLRFAADGDSAKLETALFEGEMGTVIGPRSAYLYDYMQDDYLYVVNKFPFDVRRFKLDDLSAK